VTGQDGPNLAHHFLHIPHDASGECCVCVIPVEMDNYTIQLRCNECGQVAGVIDRPVLEDLV
jgi:hypothetical protein